MQSLKRRKRRSKLPASIKRGWGGWGREMRPQQNTDDKRLDLYNKGYMKGQPDLMVLDYHKDYKGLCIEFNYHQLIIIM